MRESTRLLSVCLLALGVGAAACAEKESPNGGGTGGKGGGGGSSSTGGRGGSAGGTGGSGGSSSTGGTTGGTGTGGSGGSSTGGTGTGGSGGSAGGTGGSSATGGSGGKGGSGGAGGSGTVDGGSVPETSSAEREALDRACTPKFTLKQTDMGPKGMLFTEAVNGNAEAFVQQIGREVCRVLYRKADEVRAANAIELNIRDYDGVAAKWGDIGDIGVEISTRHLQNVKNEGRDVRAEIAGILHHEMTHMYQNDDKPEGTFTGLANMYEGIADAVRIRNGFPPAGAPARQERPLAGQGLRRPGVLLAVHRHRAARLPVQAERHDERQGRQALGGHGDPDDQREVRESVVDRIPGRHVLPGRHPDLLQVARRRVQDIRAGDRSRSIVEHDQADAARPVRAGRSVPSSATITSRATGVAQT